MPNRKTTLIASVGTLVLGATLALPALGAAPTYSGTLSCTDAVTGEQRDLNSLTGATRKEIASWRGHWRASGFCANGSFDTSHLTRDA